MPRAKKAGGPGQPNGQQPMRAATGQPYGENKAQMDAQRVMPLPQAEPIPQSTMERATAEAAPVSFNMGGFGAPSDFPNEPVTAGLATGPGAGPEALAMNQRSRPTSDTLALIASITGDQMFAELAERARSKGQ